MWQIEKIPENTLNKNSEKDNIKYNKPIRKERQEEIKRILIESIISKQKI